MKKYRILVISGNVPENTYHHTNWHYLKTLCYIDALNFLKNNRFNLLEWIMEEEWV